MIIGILELGEFISCQKFRKISYTHNIEDDNIRSEYIGACDLLEEIQLDKELSEYELKFIDNDGSLSTTDKFTMDFIESIMFLFEAFIPFDKTKTISYIIKTEEEWVNVEDLANEFINAKIGLDYSDTHFTMSEVREWVLVHVEDLFNGKQFDMVAEKVYACVISIRSKIIPREKTKQEVVLEFIKEVHSLVKYYSNDNTIDKMNELVMDLLYLLDEPSENGLPNLELCTYVEQGEIDYYIENKENYYPNNLNISGSLRDKYEDYYNQA